MLERTARGLYVTPEGFGVTHFYFLRLIKFDNAHTACYRLNKR